MSTSGNDLSRSFIHPYLSESFNKIIIIKYIINVNTTTNLKLTKIRVILKITTKKVVSKIRKDRTANFWDGA